MILIVDPSNFFSTVRTSSAVLTNDSPTKSTCSFFANAIHLFSFSCIDSRLRIAPGILTPLPSCRTASCWTRQVTLFPSIDCTVIAIEPSSMSNSCRGLTCFGNSGRSTPIASPSGVVERMIVELALRMRGSFNPRTRTLGPGMSNRIGIVASTSRTFLMMSLCCSGLPWDEFILATSIPAFLSLVISSMELVTGPIVAMIFVFLIMICLVDPISARISLVVADS